MKISTVSKASFTKSDFVARQELRSNGDFTATANRACEQPTISLRFVARQIATYRRKLELARNLVQLCCDFTVALHCRAIKSLGVNEPLIKKDPLFSVPCGLNQETW